MKIGIMGGTFDPIHLAHLSMGRAAKEQKKLDQVWFMPSKIPPHKREKKVADEKLRYHWVELSVRGIRDFFASDFELRFPHITYTAETVERLQKEYPNEKFSFILGADSLFAFDMWYHPERILNRVEILSFSRDGILKEKMEEQAAYLMDRFGGKIEVLQMRELAVSSSMIREKLAKGEAVEKFLPKALWQALPELQGEYCVNTHQEKGEKI